MQLSPVENKDFKFTWKIHNFTMIPHKVGEPLWSPTIVIGIFEGTEWNLGLYVRGYKNESDITGVIYRGKSENGEDTIPVSFEIFFKNVNGSSSLMYEKKYSFGRNSGHGFQLISRSEIFQEKKYFHPGDTLIMECRLQKYNGEHTSSTESVIRNYAFDSKFASKQALDVIKKVLKPEVGECQIRTRINVEELRFIWAIPKFCTIKPDQKLSVPVYFAGKNSPKFVLSVIPNTSTKDPEEKNIQMKLLAESEESFYCVYEILLVDSDCLSRIHMKGQHLFEIGTSMEYSVPNSLKWSELQRNKHVHIVDETLTLYYKFQIASSLSVKSFVEQTTYSPPKIGVYCLEGASHQEDKKPNDPIMEHSQGRKFCDVSLQVDDKLLRTHKIILCTWSPVFKTILEHELAEDCNILNIDDIDVVTVDRMLLYMYTQTVEDLNWRETAMLYFAAHKYKIIELLEICLKMLETKMSIENICGLLFLADMHVNENLVELATDFVKVHKDEVLRTEEWKKFMEEKGSLAAKLMHEMFVEV